MRNIIVGCSASLARLIDTIIQVNYYRDPTTDVGELLYRVTNKHGKIKKWMYDVVDFVDYIEDYILPKVKPLFNQVHSKRPINNPIAGRCY